MRKLRPRLDVLGVLICGLSLSTLGVRVVVDDANTTWEYSGPWNVITPSTPCEPCVAKPDPARAFNHTWHDVAVLATAQLVFTGVSVEVYTICPSQIYASYGTNFSFSLDNIPDGIFQGPQPACAQYMYNYLVYARTNLSMGPHVFTLTNSPISGSILLLDYAIYDDGTASPSGTTSHSSIPTAAVVVLTLIAGLLLLANIAQFLWYRRSGKFRGQVPQGMLVPSCPFVPEGA
jgi:hypothetical protein